MKALDCLMPYVVTNQLRFCAKTNQTDCISDELKLDFFSQITNVLPRLESVAIGFLQLLCDAHSLAIRNRDVIITAQITEIGTLASVS